MENDKKMNKRTKQNIEERLKIFDEITKDLKTDYSISRQKIKENK